MINNQIKEIEDFLLSFDYTKLSIQDLDIYIKMLISIENKKKFETFIPSVMNGNINNDIVDFFKKKEE